MILLGGRPAPEASWWRRNVVAWLHGVPRKLARRHWREMQSRDEWVRSAARDWHGETVLVTRHSFTDNSTDYTAWYPPD